MGRVLLGKSPEVELGTTSSTYHRAGNTGLFISKPGANVMSCSDGDLLLTRPQAIFSKFWQKEMLVFHRAAGRGRQTQEE